MESFQKEAMVLRRFNVTGTCVKNKHYMADTTTKINQIIDLIENDYYFTINRPRQYGKTTTLDLLRRQLGSSYTILNLSFEKVGNATFSSEERFIQMLYRSIKQELRYLKEENLLIKLESLKEIDTFEEFDYFLTDFITDNPKEIILLIDECDKASNNDVFLDFLGVLRYKYLRRTEDRDVTFKSVVLAGVHDVKNLKFKMRGEDERYNSPWNIATDFRIEMSFNKSEIESLLLDYLTEHIEIKMDVPAIASKIHYFTNGYPFFVSYLCKMIDEEFESLDKWNTKNLEKAVNQMLVRKITNLDDLVKNLGNNEDLERLVHAILVNGVEFEYSISGPVMEKGFVYGVFKESSGNKLAIYNPIYEMKIYKYLTDKIKTENPNLSNFPLPPTYILPDGSLDITLALKNYSKYLAQLRDDKTDKFVENNARLLFSIFMKPIINGVGFMYKEVVISDRKRLDVLITYNQFKYVIELKIWNGEAYYKQAQEQLVGYLNDEGLDDGYMIVHDFRKGEHKRSMQERISVEGKELAVYFV